MTTRCGNASLGLWRGYRTKRPAHLIEITRTDGEVVRFTDHDQEISFRDDHHDSPQLFVPAVYAGCSAERREAALRSGNQEAYMVIDRDWVEIPDLFGGRFRGAEVRDTLVDWQMPWLWVSKHRKWIRTINWADGSLVATLEGRSQVLSRAQGGRFGGKWLGPCQYVFGGPHCQKVFDSIAGPRVQTIHKQRFEVSMLTSTWTGTFADNYFKDGEILWLWAAPDFQSQCTATTTSTTLTDSTHTFVAGDVGKTLRILSGTAGEVVAYITITSVGTHTASYASDSFMAGFTAGTYYDIAADCANVGVVSPIVQHFGTARRIKFLKPTPFSIAVGDSGIVRPGCDGLLSTCINKWDNRDRHGGSPIEPTAARIVDPQPEA